MTCRNSKAHRTESLLTTISEAETGHWNVGALDREITVAGYSGTPLAKKLGIKAGIEIYVMNITEDSVREVALPLGFVDIKVCAVTDAWSGLKPVLRKELR
jgi:hypothetical protein